MTPIVPDTKDWTWVLERACPECGFDVTGFPREEAGAMIRVNATEWRDILGHDEVRERPNDSKWSALEYACHVRDVFRLYADRLEMMLDQNDPTYPNWDQDATAVAEQYEEQDPNIVSSELGAAATALADRFDQVEGDQWERTGNRSDGISFTIESFARYLMHDPIHHLHDVRTGFEELSQRR